MTFRTLILISLAACVIGGERAPMPVNFRDSAESRWLNKMVLESRLEDDMERLDHWAQMTLTGERSRDGGHSIRLRTPTRLEDPR